LSTALARPSKDTLDFCKSDRKPTKVSLLYLVESRGSSRAPNVFIINKATPLDTFPAMDGSNPMSPGSCSLFRAEDRRAAAGMAAPEDERNDPDAAE